MPYPRRNKEPAIVKVEIPWYKQMSNDMKMSLTTLKYNKTRYVSFFLILFLLQGLFASVIILNKINDKAVTDATEGEFDYHLDLKDLNDSQAYYLINLENGLEKEARYFKVTGMQKGDLEGIPESKYDVQILFTGGSIPRCYRVFTDMYYSTLNSYGEFTEVFSPLYTTAKQTVVADIVCFFISLLIMLVAFVMIYILFSVMTNHYKFTYGIYQSFGANFKKLFSSAISDFIWLNMLAFLPALIFANVVCLIIALLGKVDFVFCWYASFLGFLLTLVASSIAVFVNMRITASKTPNQLIIAADNANHITSPRDSYDIENLEFPRGTSVLSLMRFRKYYVKLFAGVLAFSTLFVSMSYVADCYSESLASDRADYTVDFQLKIVTQEVEREDPDAEANEDDDNGDDENSDNEFRPDSDKVTQSDIVTTVSGQDYDGEIRKSLYEKLPSLEIILKSCAVNATEINSHIAVNEDNVSNRSGVKIDKSLQGYSNVSYNALDEEMIDILDYLGAEIEGSLTDVLNDPKMIAICDGYSNSRKFKFKVGDKILIATDYVKLKNTSGVVTSDHDDMLKEYLDSYEYTYTEYTVGAVISELPTDSVMPIYMNYDLFESVMGYRPYFDHIDVILDKNASKEDIKHSGYVLRNHADYYGNMTVNQTDSDFYLGLEENKNYSSVFLYISTVLLAVIPIIWIFTQILFYQKRKQEFDVFFAIGADNSEIKQIFMLEGAILTALSVVTYVLFGLLSVALLRYVANSEMWQYLVSTERIMRFDFKLPIWQFAVGLVITALGAFLSSYFSYGIYRKNCHPVFTGLDLNDTEQTVIANTDDNN